MTAKITASTSSGLVLDSDLSGSLALVANGITVATLNGTGANAGIQMGTSMAPAFSAYASSAQTFSSGSVTKVLFDTEDFDTNGNFGSSRFTPTVAGYYQINTSMTAVYPSGESHYNVYKNGSQYRQLQNTQGAYTYTLAGSCIVYCNGSTDYIEIYFYTANGVTNIANGPHRTWFQGALVRSA
jgi:hypothetical protein